MAVLYPVAGSFSAYSTRFLDPSWGFAMGWNYAMQWLVVLPLEIIAATLTINFWNNGRINNDAWVGIFLVVIVAINFFGVKGYAEAEYVFAIIKVIAVVGFIILGVILVCGAGPQGGYIGGQHWHNPGAFNNGFKGLCSVFVTAAFAFAGTELVGLAAAETANPRKVGLFQPAGCHGADHVLGSPDRHQAGLLAHHSLLHSVPYFNRSPCTVQQPGSIEWHKWRRCQGISIRYSHQQCWYFRSSFYHERSNHDCGPLRWQLVCLWLVTYTGCSCGSRAGPCLPGVH